MIQAISPLDGRYKKRVEDVASYFSEKSLFFYRTLVEIKWLKYLSENKEIQNCRLINHEESDILEKIVSNFSDEDFHKIKSIEQITNHDVKAVEYYIKDEIKNTSLVDISEWVHFSLTSEDVNNLAYALMIKDYLSNILIKKLEDVKNDIVNCVEKWKGNPMLSRTHGQPASPTTVSKEFCVFYCRLSRQLKLLKNQEILGKLAGASGNFNAHSICFDIDWMEFSKNFVESLGLINNPVVTQIEPHDFIAEISHNIIRINNIVIDFNRDIWTYISQKFFKQKIKKNEVGSSAMPHKVNPIDFENSEGNLGVSNSLFEFFANKLPISRMQRDLTDSTVMRNLGLAFGYNFLALSSVQKGISKLELNKKELINDLNNNVEILAEAIQTVMRKNSIQSSYEKLKELTRGEKLSIDDVYSFVEKLDIDNEDKKILLNLTPEKYIGIADEIAFKYKNF